VPTDDLNSLPGLEDKHLRALARAEVTDLRGLAGADQREIYKATANIRPRPSLERIAQWQGEARARLDEPETAAEVWQTTASFAVIFAQRPAAGGWERRITAEQTEVEPEQDRQVWDGWDTVPIGRWMAGQLPGADSAGAAAPADPPHEEAAPASAEAPEAASEEEEEEEEEATAPTQLTIEGATVTGADGEFDAIVAGVLATGWPAELTAPVRVAFTVRGARPGTALRAVARFLRPDGPGWNPRDPVAPDHSGRAEFDLSEVPADRYDVTLIAWAPDGTAKPVSARLPTLTIRPAGR